MWCSFNESSYNSFFFKLLLIDLSLPCKQMRTVLEKAQKYFKSKSNSQRKNKTFYIYWSSGLFFNILVLQNVISGQSQLWLIFQTKSREIENHIQYTAASALFVLINRTKTSGTQQTTLQCFFLCCQNLKPHLVCSGSHCS